MSTLEKTLDDFIAKIDGVRPEDVTLEYIRARRKEMYESPDHQFSNESEYGGYETEGLETQTPAEIALEAERADRFLKQPINK